MSQLPKFGRFASVDNKSDDYKRLRGQSKDTIQIYLNQFFQIIDQGPDIFSGIINMCRNPNPAIFCPHNNS